MTAEYGNSDDNFTDTTNVSDDCDSSAAICAPKLSKISNHSTMFINMWNEKNTKSIRRFMYFGGRISISSLAIFVLSCSIIVTWLACLAGVYLDVVKSSAEFHRQFIHVYVCIVQTIIHYYTITGVVKQIMWNMKVYMLYAVFSVLLLLAHCTYELVEYQYRNYTQNEVRDKLIFTAPFVAACLGNALTTLFVYRTFQFLRHCSEFSFKCASPARLEAGKRSAKEEDRFTKYMFGTTKTVDKASIREQTPILVQKEQV